ncbi:hypothetical protein SAMN06265373_106145 [Shimia sagamensis]|uniref:Uncharacterized protein n=1 Tax=Shimia sagamensis TaxID=1566352 RepID=A0ABY1P907_9RHOB|nr:hypothetical protein SAMN06265373_106145 [Shimia sagamensis]
MLKTWMKIDLSRDLQGRGLRNSLLDVRPGAFLFQDFVVGTPNLLIEKGPCTRHCRLFPKNMTLKGIF